MAGAREVDMEKAALAIKKNNRKKLSRKTPLPTKSSMVRSRLLMRLPQTKPKQMRRQLMTVSRASLT